MSKMLENVESEALKLPDNERLELASRILASVEARPEPGAEAAWEAEIRRRIENYDSGKSTTITGSKVFEDMDKKLRG